MTFVVDADASQEGIGAVLSHQHNGRVIAYASRVLTKTERQYCATRHEMLALVWSVRQFRAYLWGRKFIVRTDHNALRWLRNFKDPQGQVARWLEILAEFLILMSFTDQVYNMAMPMHYQDFNVSSAVYAK